MLPLMSASWKWMGLGFQPWPLTREFFIIIMLQWRYCIHCFMNLLVSRSILFFFSLLLLSVFTSGGWGLGSLCGPSYLISDLTTQFLSPVNYTILVVCFVYFFSPNYFIILIQLSQSLITTYHVLSMCPVSGNPAQCLAHRNHEYVYYFIYFF